MQRKTIKTYTRIFSGIVIVWAGPCGVPGHGSLSVSPVSCLQGIDFSLHDLPGVPKRRFKQLLSGKRGCRDQGGGRQDRGRSNDSKGIQPVHPKGNQPWLFSGRTDAEAETPVLWPPDAKSWLIGKELDGDGDGRAYDGWMASLTQWTWVWDSEGQGSLACCSPWGCKESDTTERMKISICAWVLSCPVMPDTVQSYRL